MSKLASQLIGAKGLDSRTSKFLMDPLRSEVAENFLVRGNSRKTRQFYERFLYSQYQANGLKIRSREKQFVVVKDPTNTTYEAFGGTTGKGTMFFRLRLHGEEGFTFASSIPVVSRELYTSSVGSGIAGHMQVTLEAVDSPPHDEYYIQLSLTNASTGGFTQATSTLKVGFGDWHAIAIRYSPISGDVDFYLDGTWETFGGMSGQAGTGDYIHDSIENFHGDLLFGATEDLATFADFDIDEFRLYNDDMADSVIEDNDDVELSGADATQANLQCYINFQEDSDKHVIVDKINSSAYGFLGGYRAYIDEDTELVTDGSHTYGELSTSTVLGFTYTIFNSNRTNEIALTFLKMKQGWIAGDLELVPDTGNSKWAVKFHFEESALFTAQTLTTPGFIEESDVATTKFYIGVRIDTFSTQTVKIYVDGVEVASHALSGGIWGPRAAGTGRNIGTKETLIEENTALKVEWVRAMRWTKPEEYFTTYYNQDVPQVDIDTVRHGTVDGTYNSGGSRVDIVPNAATWETSISLPTYIGSIGQIKPGYEHSDQGQLTATDTGNIPVPTRGPWSDITPENGDLVIHEDDYALTLLVVNFDSVSFNDIVEGIDLGIAYAENNSLATDGFDRVGRSNLRLTLRRRYPTGNPVDYDRPPLRVFSPTKLTDSLNQVRFMRQFRDEASNIDVLVVIVGTGLMTVDIDTLAITDYPISIEVNAHKRFTSAILENQLYITDGVSKLHLFVYRGKLKATYWGMAPPPKLPSATAFTGTSNPVTHEIYYTYAYYNRFIDQYSNIAPLDADGYGTVLSGARRAGKLDDLVPPADPVNGPTDIVILGTRVVSGSTDKNDLRIIDYVGSRSTGAMDWNQATPGSALERWPREFLGGEDLSPPDGEIVVSHRARLWVLKGRTLHYSRISSNLHADIKSETYNFPSDHSIVVDAEQDLTAAISLDGMLFVFTCAELFVLSGFDRSDFDLRPLYSGRGCVSHHTLKRYGKTFIWLGQDDIYQLVNGRPEPVDAEGKISQYLKDNLNLEKLDEAFAVVNRNQELYELHVIRRNGDRIAIYWDLKTKEFTVGTDLLATVGTEVEQNCRSTVYLGHEKSFIVRETDTETRQNYEPPSGPVSGTIVSLSGSDTLITSESTLYTSFAGLRGNTVYVISQQANTIGSVLRARIVSNTGTNIVFTDSAFVFGNVFVPGNGDLFYIAPIFWHWKSGVLSSGRQSIIIQKEALRNDGELFSDVISQELVEIEFLHEATSTNAKGYFRIYREDNNSEDPLEILNLDSYSSAHQFASSSKHRFLQIEAFVIDGTGTFELAGFVLDRNLTRGAHVA